MTTQITTHTANATVGIDMNNTANNLKDTESLVVAIENSDTVTSLLPIEKLNIDLVEFGLTTNEEELRSGIIDDLQKAQFFAVASLYHYIRVGAKLAKVKYQLNGKKGRYTNFIKSVGINERTAHRYVTIASDKRFLEMTENEFKKLYHITQSKMIKMTKFKEDKFYEAINDEDFEFETTKKEFKKPSDCIIDDDMFNIFMKRDKAYIINEYNSLLSSFKNSENVIEVSDTTKEVE